MRTTPRRRGTQANARGGTWVGMRPDSWPESAETRMAASPTRRRPTTTTGTRCPFCARCASHSGGYARASLRERSRCQRIRCLLSDSRQNAAYAWD